MEHPHEPVDAIKEWQDWYKKHRIVAQMDEPLVTKDSRETCTTQLTQLKVLQKQCG